MLTFFKAIPLQTYLWGALIVAAVSFHYIDRSRAVYEALANQKAKVEVQYLKGEVEYRDRWIDTEGMLSFLAARDRSETLQRNRSILAQAAAAKKEYHDALPAAGNFVIDAERVRRFNKTVTAPRPPRSP